MANKGWSKRFDEPIVLDDGTILTTLRQAIEYLAKTVPKAVHNHPNVFTASDGPPHLAYLGAADGYRCHLRHIDYCIGTAEQWPR
jgi:hypothetical protein